MGDKVRKLVEYHEEQIRNATPQPQPQKAPEPSNSALQEELKRQGPGKLERQDFWDRLEKNLRDTGRVDPTSEESTDKREAYSGKILLDMENTTRERQKAQGGGALAHGVLGHGKGTDQISRMVHGRRNDELVEDQHEGRAPGEVVKLTGNKHKEEDQEVAKYSTVGSDPSNTSGAFTSNIGMLHVVESAFAQASMLSAEEEARKEIDGSSLSDERFVTTVEGPGGGIGYNLELDDPSIGSLEPGQAIDPATMQTRFEHIQRTDGLKNATVVLDPAYVGDGPQKKRAGWQMQTAFAHNNAPGTRLDSPEDVEDFAKAKNARRQAELELKQAQKRLDDATKRHQDNGNKIVAVGKAIVSIKKGVDGRKNSLANAQGDEARAKAQQLLTEIEERLAAKEKELDELNDQVKPLEDAMKEAKVARDQAKAKVDAL